ncbi:MAG: ParB/RepB/Spo0J family partition protein [Alphaproteobacteria bacterium]
MAKKTLSKKITAKKAASSKRGLGRGLSALMDDVSMDNFVSDDVVIVDDIMDSPQPMDDALPEAGNFTAPSPSTEAPTQAEPSGAIKGGVTFVSMGQLERNPEQPRRHFDAQLLEELATSVRQKGILQPILVRALPDSKRNKPVYQIVAGERRWQAAMKAGLDVMPVFVREITDQEALEIGVIENVQRAELNPVEEAMAYKALISQFGRTQEDVANAVGKSRSYVANMMRLLSLPETVQTYLAEGKISTGHARAIIAAPDPTELASLIVKSDLSVRDAENWARKLKKQDDPVLRPEKAMKAADEKRLEAELMDALGLSVDLRHRGPGGELRIKYKSNDQLEDVMKRLKKD